MSDTMKYFDLSIPAAKRLQMMRHDYTMHALKHPDCPEYAKPKSWRDIRRAALIFAENTPEKSKVDYI